MVLRGLGNAFRLFWAACLFATVGCTLSTSQPGGGRVPHDATAAGCVDPFPIWVDGDKPSDNPFDYESMRATMARVADFTGVAGSDYRCAYVKRGEKVNGQDVLEIIFYHYTADGKISSPLTVSFHGTPEIGKAYPVDLSGGELTPLVASAALDGAKPLFPQPTAGVATSGTVRFDSYPDEKGSPFKMSFQAVLAIVSYAGGAPLNVRATVEIDY